MTKLEISNKFVIARLKMSNKFDIPSFSLKHYGIKGTTRGMSNEFDIPKFDIPIETCLFTFIFYLLSFLIACHNKQR